jgi:uncharacterized protein YbjT (DUF2867 family)
MKILVIGGAGNVGSQVVKELLAHDLSIRVLVHTPEKANTIPEGVEVVIGDLLDPETLRSVFNNIDRVFMLLPVSPNETSLGLFALNGARSAGVKRIVYMSLQGIEEGKYIPHFGSKFAVEEGIKTSGIPYTILRPNSFYQNDSMRLKGPLLQQGVYLAPIGDVGLSRVDVGDIAEAAAIALTMDGHLGATYNLVGPDILTGQRTAEIWGKVLNKHIAYVGNDLDAWEKIMLQYMPAWWVYEYKILFDFYQKKGLKGTPADLERFTTLLGHPPRSFEDFAKEMAGIWKV